MKFPAGADRGVVSNPSGESLASDLRNFRGACQIETGDGHGFVLVENGRNIAAYFRTDSGVLLGNNALLYLDLPSLKEDDILESRLRDYNDSEYSLALQIARYENLICTENEPDGREPAPQGAHGESPASPSPSMKKVPEKPDVQTLERIKSIPGVVAVSAFFEGFPVLSVGDADFEHIAVSAEDFMRAGTKIAQEMKIGTLDQLILETATRKVIIAPCGDLFLCIVAHSDAQLGHIRIVLKSIVSELLR